MLFLTSSLNQGNSQHACGCCLIVLSVFGLSFILRFAETKITLFESMLFSWKSSNSTCQSIFEDSGIGSMKTHPKLSPTKLCVRISPSHLQLYITNQTS